MFDKVKRKDYTHSSKGDAPSAMYQKTLSYYITMLYRSFAGFTGDKLQEVGLNFGLLFFIVYIGKRPNCTPSELTKELSLDWGHSQRCINRLVDDGLITKEKNGRHYMLNLTERGQLRPLLNAEVAPYITKLSVHKIHKIINGFGEAAVLAVRAGFDMVQIHGDRMCGSFSSSVFNHRTDEYGGSAENRARFAVESVRAVRSRLPELPIDYKLAVRQEEPHYGNAGVVESELEIFVPMLVGAGVTSFHVTLANHSSLEDTIPPANHPYFKEQGCFLKFCDEVRQYTDKPITGVGGLTQPDFVEQQLASGRISCAAMSRQLLADPEWPNKVAAGQIKDIHRCVRCNKKCLGG